MQFIKRANTSSQIPRVREREKVKDFKKLEKGGEGRGRKISPAKTLKFNGKLIRSRRTKSFDGQNINDNVWRVREEGDGGRGAGSGSGWETASRRNVDSYNLYLDGKFVHVAP